jgi:hypothetical protein
VLYEGCRRAVKIQHSGSTFTISNSRSLLDRPAHLRWCAVLRAVTGSAPSPQDASAHPQCRRSSPAAAAAVSRGSRCCAGRVVLRAGRWTHGAVVEKCGGVPPLASTGHTLCCRGSRNDAHPCSLYEPADGRLRRTHVCFGDGCARSKRIFVVCGYLQTSATC